MVVHFLGVALFPFAAGAAVALGVVRFGKCFWLSAWPWPYRGGATASGHHSRFVQIILMLPALHALLGAASRSRGELPQAGTIAPGSKGCTSCTFSPFEDESAASDEAAGSYRDPRPRASSLGCFTYTNRCNCHARRHGWRVVTGSTPPVTTRAIAAGCG